MTISDDKKTITLDIPLGTKVYTYRTNCNNTCYRNSSDTMEGQPSPELIKKEKAFGVTCNSDAPCHVLYTGLQSEVLTTKNFDEILPLLGKKWFTDHNQAREAGIRLVLDHRQILRDNGIPFGEHAQSLIQSDYLNGVRTEDSLALGREIDKKTAPDYHGEED